MTDVADPSWTVLRLLDWTKGYFERCGLESPRLCAEMLLAHCLSCRRVELYARHDRQPPDDQRRQYRELVRQAAEGYPVAYLVGKKQFYSLDFKITPDVLIPRPETELLVDQAVTHLRPAEQGFCWDVCTGSGCVAVAVAKNSPRAQVLATDLSPQAVTLAAENATAHDVADRVICAVADLLTLPPEWTGPTEFDVVTINPPYVAEADEVGKGVEHEPRAALYSGPTGLEVIQRLIPAAPARLKSGGLLCLEFGAGQADAVRDLLVASGAFAEPTILKDHQNIERAAAARRK